MERSETVVAVIERLHQTVGTHGLQIPVTVMRRYGHTPGRTVVLEMRRDGIHILPAVPEREDVEHLALCYLLTHLGDGATVEVQKENGDWRVSVYGIGVAEPVGELLYSPEGEFLSDRSTTVEEMRHRVATGAMRR